MQANLPYSDRFERQEVTMSNSRCRPPSMPPFSTRTLQHPSFLPLYLCADLELSHTDFKNQTAPSITPIEFFYTDPSLSYGRRIPNIVSELRVLEYFQLNTPPPVMSSCIAPPVRPDPFRSAPHHSRDLGSPTLKMNPLLPPVQLCQAVIQLTQEEDQAITNLLKLHHQEPPVSNKTINAPLKHSCSTLVQHQPESTHSSSDEQHSREAGCWSVEELEAANTLLSCFGLMEKNQNLRGSAVLPPDPLLHQSHGGFEDGRGADHAHLPVCEESFNLSLSQKSIGDYSERERTLSDSERDAVHALQNLGDMEAMESCSLEC